MRSNKRLFNREDRQLFSPFFLRSSFTGRHFSSNGSHKLWKRIDHNVK